MHPVRHLIDGTDADKLTLLHAALFTILVQQARDHAERQLVDGRVGWCAEQDPRFGRAQKQGRDDPDERVCLSSSWWSMQERDAHARPYGLSPAQNAGPDTPVNSAGLVGVERTIVAPSFYHSVNRRQVLRFVAEGHGERHRLLLRSRHKRLTGHSRRPVVPSGVEWLTQQQGYD